MATKKKNTPEKLRLVIEFDIEAKDGQTLEEARQELAQSFADSISSPDGASYSCYSEGGVPLSESADKGYEGPYLTGIRVNRQDANNKASIPLVEYTSWL